MWSRYSWWRSACMRRNLVHSTWCPSMTENVAVSERWERWCVKWTRTRNWTIKTHCYIYRDSIEGLIELFCCSKENLTNLEDVSIRGFSSVSKAATCEYKLYKYQQERWQKDTHTHCGATYIGETGRKLHTRVQEHKRAVCKGSDTNNDIAVHVIKMNHTIQWEKHGW